MMKTRDKSEEVLYNYKVGKAVRMVQYNPVTRWDDDYLARRSMEGLALG